MLEAMMDTMVQIYVLVAKTDTIHPLVPEDADMVLFEMDITEFYMFMRLTWHANRIRMVEGWSMEDAVSHTHKILHEIPREEKVVPEIPVLTIEDLDY